MNDNQKTAALEIAIELSTGQFSNVETPLVQAIVEAAMPLFLARSREGMASKLIDIWAKEHGGGQVPWETAVDITAILTGMPDAERDRLILLADESVMHKSASPEDILSEYWLENYAPQDVCVLCGNSGIVDTNGTAFWPDGKPAGGRHWCFCPNGRERRKDTDDANPDIVAPKKQRAPDGYAYRYPAQHLDPEVQKNYPTEIRFTHGQEMNGYKPVETIPYFFGVPSANAAQPAPYADQRVIGMEFEPRKLALHTVYADEGAMAELEALIRQGKKYTEWQLRGIPIGRIPPFADVWAQKEKEGLKYGPDALEQVRFGYELAIDAISTELWQSYSKQDANPAQLDIPLECSDLPGGN